MNTSWAVSSHWMEPTRTEPSVGMRCRLLTMENFMFSARFGASEWGPWWLKYSRRSPSRALETCLKPGMKTPQRPKIRMMARGYARAEDGLMKWRPFDLGLHTVKAYMRRAASRCALRAG